MWVTQGWTFGYQHDFWDRSSLQALLSRVPDDKMIIIDLGNDYPKWVWGTEQTWKNHDGFYGKKWIFSYVPNFGGKDPDDRRFADVCYLVGRGFCTAGKPGI